MPPRASVSSIRFPDIDILVNNAGAIPGGSLDDVESRPGAPAGDLKVYGYVGLTRLYLRKMKERRRGVIVNVIGVGGEKTGRAVYRRCGRQRPV